MCNQDTEPTTEPTAEPTLHPTVFEKLGLKDYNKWQRTIRRGDLILKDCCFDDWSEAIFTVEKGKVKLENCRLDGYSKLIIRNTSESRTTIDLDHFFGDDWSATTVELNNGLITAKDCQTYEHAILKLFNNSENASPNEEVISLKDCRFNDWSSIPLHYSSGREGWSFTD